ncbi:MAG TPA: hypothetical protein VEJ20_02310, partial [Candidatus Eremiobacteraceae bacterium]|nr:hypothetical protein [Candidatus Eremiobacteraceae bacterium]
MIRDATAPPSARVGDRLREALSGKRVLIGALVAAIGIASIFYAPAFAALIALIGVLGVFELKSLSRRTGADLSAGVAVAACVAYAALAYFGLLARYESMLA